MYAVAGNLLGASADPDRYDAGNAVYDCTSATAALGCVRSLQAGTAVGGELLTLWDSVFDPSLRNAIGHSDFVVAAPASLYVVSNLMRGGSGHPTRRGQAHYRLEDVKWRAKQAHVFLDAFAGQVTSYWPSQSGSVPSE